VGVGDLSVSTAKIQDSSITTAKIQDNSITTAKIAAGAVIPADLSTGAPSWTEAGLLQFNSGYGSVATAYGCRAWVNFNGTGTVAIRGSGNVTSITDNGTGDYTVNFTTAMPDTNYALVSNANDNGVSRSTTNLALPTTTTARITLTANGSNTSQDASTVSVAVFR
jgi:hypothetical protein